MARTLNLHSAADLAAAVVGARPDAAASGITITSDWCRDQMHSLGETRYEDVTEALLHAICDQVDALPSTQDFHVTAIRDGGVYGHLASGCDESGCAGDERYLNGTPADEVEVGHVYAITDDGTVVAEVE
jgi:hypothetical protein